ncbi:hypothetical protein CORC01_10081 [Colletotrichum orchidophilum]|uniref:DUF7791 domain-containing protein n=1 Tax=Colletotrichum orchidophilum TaxID=1209926 RepID=A0A1G4AZP0_9PEZI|nr:uncharacterized protein CORC01_10081 [Colletotrichum orchidophilum]OHE94553.1 hypothetical protein CORC01_10081 [Colletotrichum orchidophilum]
MEKWLRCCRSRLTHGSLCALGFSSFHDFEYDDENYSSEEATELMPADLKALNKAFRSVSRCINGRSKGLLERNGDRREFLHRTLHNFLRSDEMNDFLRDHRKNRHCPIDEPLAPYDKQDWQWADGLLIFADKHMLLMLPEQGADPTATNVRHPARAHSLKRPAAYEGDSMGDVE